MGLRQVKLHPGNILRIILISLPKKDMQEKCLAIIISCQLETWEIPKREKAWTCKGNRPALPRQKPGEGTIHAGYRWSLRKVMSVALHSRHNPTPSSLCSHPELFPDQNTNRLYTKN